MAPSERDLRSACQVLADRDEALAKAHDRIGLPNWRVIEPTFEALARMIAYQQISTRAASAIWGRVCNRLPAMTPADLLGTPDDTLRDCGLSRPKISHMRAIAVACDNGALCMETLCAVPIDEARKHLTAVKGIGPWTADVFLMTATGALDAFPAGDVGLMESYRLLRGDDAKLPPKVFLKRAETWRPFRGVAAHLLWDWINNERGRDVAPAPEA
ncbi:MAG: DNA-3-methyladenine glycosylase 2 family protein [Pseudomonadota bacterium]